MTTQERSPPPIEADDREFPIAPPADRWDAQRAAGMGVLEVLAYRSNLLGSDRSVANWGGGNTSAKTSEPDFRGIDTNVLYVKGSGSDLGTIRSDQFTALRLDDLRLLEARESMSDEDLVAYFAHAGLRPNQPRASIETPLHSMLDAAHIDHTHPDAIIALCGIPSGPELAKRLWADRFIWVPYERPGFGLGKKIAAAIRDRPGASLVLMAKHGLVTWGDTAEECYRSTIATIAAAAEALSERADRRTTIAIGATRKLAPEQLAAALPALRGAISANRPMVLQLDSGAPAVAFASRPDLATVAGAGPACPDHLIHTKPWPLVVSEASADAFRTGVAAFREQYAAYHARCGGGEQLHDPSPRIVLVPGVGVITTGPDAGAASVARALYERAIAVLSGTDRLGGFSPLTEAEMHAIEYWPLELAKLARAEKPSELAGQVALVTGAASGIGRAIARRLGEAGAHVVIADRNLDGAREVADEIEHRNGAGRALALAMDVTDEAAVIAGFRDAVLTYGGLDILVSNAGISDSAPIEDTTLADWNRQQAVLGTGYFLVAREAFRVLRRQDTGGSVVFIASKNALVAGRNAAAYSAAKAAELHLARCLAEEGGAAGIRVNTVNPDAVLRGSGIWDTAWREERAQTYGIHPSELEDFYRARTTLKVSIEPDDVAEAVLFFASQRSAKSTGNMLNVDGGVAAAYSR